MSEREDILIGFQVIEKTNMGNDSTDNAAWYMQNKRPHSDDALVMWSDEETPTSRPAEPEDIKQLTEVTSKIIDLEVETRLEKFLERYNNPSAVARGLQHFNTRRQDVTRDTSEVKLHKTSVRNVNALIHDHKGLRANGELLSLYKETVELHVLGSVHLPREQHIITVYQDVLNAVSLELQGLCSYNGELRYPEFTERKELALSRLSLTDAIYKDLPSTAETRGFRVAQLAAQGAIIEASTIQDLTTIGLDLVTKVPQLPLLRRWWNFN